MSGKAVQTISLMFRVGARMGGTASIVAAAVLITGCSTVPGAKKRALTELSGLKQRSGVAVSRQEYWSIEETIARAEVHLARGERQRGETLYDLAAGKAKLLSERLDRERSGTGEEQHSTLDPLPDHAPKQPASASAVEVSAPEPTAAAAESAKPWPVRDAAEQEETATAPESNGFRSPVIVGKRFSYTVGKGESLRYVGAKFGVNWRQLAQHNRIDPRRPLKAGQVLRIDTRRIVPRRIDDGIVINIPDRTLYYFRNGDVDRIYSVAVGKPKPPNDPDKRAWHTPTGTFRIIGKMKDPTWRVPPSIQKEMKEQGKEVKTVVQPGAGNPLGKYALRTSLPGILIHSTNFPESVYGFSSHGCIRVFPEFMEDLFNAVTVDTAGEIIYEPIKLTVSSGGRVLLEVHRDIYNRHGNLHEQVKTIAQEYRVTDRINWDKVKRVLKGMTGVPEDVSL